MRHLGLIVVVAVGCGSTRADEEILVADSMFDTVAPSDARGDASTDVSSADSTLDIGRLDSADGRTDAAEDAPDAACPPGRGTWAWGSDVVDKSADRAAFFAFAASHSVRVVYVEAEGLLTGTAPDPPLLASFVAEAKARCIDVQLLFGRATWLRPAEQANAVALVDKSVAFAKKHPTAAPIGVHFDVEPHGLPEWHSDVWDGNNETLVGQYLDLLAKLKTAAGATLELSVDIPFWYDGTHQVTRAGKRRPAMELVIDAVDVTTIMDYRDVADGSDGIVANAMAELTYGSSVGKRVVVGLETKCGLTPTSVTFCEEGAAAMETQLAAAQTSFASKSAFAGFAVHHYVSWSTMKK